VLREGFTNNAIKTPFGGVALELTIPHSGVELGEPLAEPTQVLGW
jgi:hypothetical protein